MTDLSLPRPVLAQDHCRYCDGTGDVHSPDGEWRGECNCDESKQQPAFLRNYDSDGHNGMTLRDYFAAKAMTMKFGATGTSSDLSHHAKLCYEMADAMLEARE